MQSKLRAKNFSPNEVFGVGWLPNCLCRQKGRRQSVSPTIMLNSKESESGTDVFWRRCFLVARTAFSSISMPKRLFSIRYWASLEVKLPKVFFQLPARTSYALSKNSPEPQAGSRILMFVKSSGDFRYGILQILGWHKIVRKIICKRWGINQAFQA